MTRRLIPDRGLIGEIF